MSLISSVLPLATLAALLFAPGVAFAYPTMIRHGYTGCAECHSVPSGGGVLTEYGRAQAEVLLTTQYSKPDPEWGPGKEKDFLFGLLDLPDQLALQIDHRSLVIPEPCNFRWIMMQSDLRGQVHIGSLRAYAEAGFADEGAWGAWLTTNESGNNLTSREHWLGVDLGETLLLRAGRMALPFGLRSEEHLLFNRTVTRTDTNADQSHGLALAWTQGTWRAELMGIAGNYQLSPDDYRERGGSGFLAMAPNTKVEIGLSGLWTQAALDVDMLRPRTRQSWGFFARGAPLTPLVLSTELDLLHDQVEDQKRTGGTGYLQADAELIQGVHLRTTGEYCDEDLSDSLQGIPTGWLTALWFVTPRVDLRLDGLRGALYCSSGGSAAWMGMAQLHLFL